jgi:8-oxo-dGTP diphosphatase
MPGTYGIPGGGVEARETLESALKREVLEETGLKVRKILNYLSYFDITLEKTGRVRNFIFSVDVEPGDVKLTEHESYSWVSSKELNEFKLTKEMKGILEINL